MGADEYMTKPIGINELLARILAILRRTRPTGPTAANAPAVITIGDLRIDLPSQQVQLAGAEIRLTPTEFALIRELAINRGKLLSHAHLLRSVWGPGYVTETDYLHLHQPAAHQARAPRHHTADVQPARRRILDHRRMSPPGRALLPTINGDSRSRASAERHERYGTHPWSRVALADHSWCHMINERRPDGARAGVP
jgi:hypothetical protein